MQVDSELLSSKDRAGAVQEPRRVTKGSQCLCDRSSELCAAALHEALLAMIRGAPLHHNNPNRELRVAPSNGFEWLSKENGTLLIPSLSL